MVTQPSKISEAAQRVQALEVEIHAEKDELAKYIGDLKKALEDQEREMKEFFHATKQELARLVKHANGDTQKPPNLGKRTRSARVKRDLLAKSQLEVMRKRR